MNRKKCNSCNADIFWIKIQPSGKAMPLNAEPSEAGNIHLMGEWGTVLAGIELANARAAKLPLYVSHFATCPNAGGHRKAKESAHERRD